MSGSISAKTKAEAETSHNITKSSRVAGFTCHRFYALMPAASQTLHSVLITELNWAESDCLWKMIVLVWLLFQTDILKSMFGMFEVDCLKGYRPRGLLISGC